MSGNRKTSFKWLSLVLLCWCSFVISVQAQVWVKGKVTSVSLPLSGVRVDLRRDSTSDILTYTFTDGEGRFNLNTSHTGKVMLSFMALSYETIHKEIELLQSEINVDIALKPGGIRHLQEVVIHGKRPYRIGKDTTELNVNSFMQGDERTVEDLLKKIPGLTVGADGSIKVGDKEVEKVMIEGDDFFEKGYRLLTQNMSVEPLEKIQILQRYSNNKHLKGIENSDKVALNLQLKEGSKSKWLGSITAAATPTKPLFYNGNFNLLNFGKKNKYFLLGSTNNNGVDAVSSINHLIYSSQTDEPGQVGQGISTPKIIDYTPDLPAFDYKRTNFNQDRLLSFNTILNPAKRLKIKGVGFINTTKKSFYQNTVLKYDIKDIRFTNIESYELSKHINNYYSKLELQYEVNNRSTLSYSGSMGSLGRKDAGKLFFNGINTAESISNQGIVTNHNLNYTFKLSDQEALVSAVRWIRQQSPLRYNIDQYNYEDLFEVGGLTGAEQGVQNNLQYLGLTSHYVRRLNGGDFLEVAFVNEYKDQGLSTDFRLLSGEGNTSHSSEFLNKVRLNTKNSSLITKYTMKGRKWEWIPELDAGLVCSGLQRYGVTKHQTNWLITPRVSARWQPYHKGKLEARLSFQQANTELTDVVQNYYSTSIRNFEKGLNNIATLSSSEAVLTYTHGNMLDKFMLSFSFGHKILFDYISSQSVINANFMLAERILLKDKKNTFLKAQVNYYVKPLNGNFKFDLGADFANYRANVVGVGNRNIRSVSADYSLSFRSVWKSLMNIHTGYRLQISAFDSERESRLNNTYGFLNLFMNISEGFQANLKNEAYHFGNLFPGSSKTYLFSDLSLSYDVPKTKVRLSITGKNLFDNRQFSNAVITDTYSATTEYQLLPRYIAFGIDYSF
jgi:hypothetical protein